MGYTVQTPPAANTTFPSSFVDTMVTNDQSFHDGTGIAADAILGSHIASYSTKRNNNTSNIIESAALLQTGWQGGVAGGTITKFSFAITFPTAFTNKPIVIASSGGDQTSGSAVYGSGGDNVIAGIACKVGNITNTGCVIVLTSTSGSWVSGNVLYVQWIAIGV